MDFIDYKNLEVILYGHPSLRKECHKIVEFNENLEKIIERMATLMYQEKGVGLAAPQVGIECNLILVDSGEDLHVLINPVILETDGEQIGPEGCLSFPGLVAEISRPKYIKVGAQNEKGLYREIQGEGLFARAVCHENDHLIGKLFIDFLNEPKKLMYASDLKLFQEATMERFGYKPGDLLK